MAGISPSYSCHSIAGSLVGAITLVDFPGSRGQTPFAPLHVDEIVKGISEQSESSSSYTRQQEFHEVGQSILRKAAETVRAEGVEAVRTELVTRQSFGSHYRGCKCRIRRPRGAGGPRIGWNSAASG